MSHIETIPSYEEFKSFFPAEELKAIVEADLDGEISPLALNDKARAFVLDVLNTPSKRKFVEESNIKEFRSILPLLGKIQDLGVCDQTAESFGREGAPLKEKLALSKCKSVFQGVILGMRYASFTKPIFSYSLSSTLMKEKSSLSYEEVQQLISGEFAEVLRNLKLDSIEYAKTQLKESKNSKKAANPEAYLDSVKAVFNTAKKEQLTNIEMFLQAQQLQKSQNEHLIRQIIALKGDEAKDIIEAQFKDDEATKAEALNLYEAIQSGSSTATDFETKTVEKLLKDAYNAIRNQVAEESARAILNQLNQAIISDSTSTDNAETKSEISALEAFDELLIQQQNNQKIIQALEERIIRFQELASQLTTDREFADLDARMSALKGMLDTLKGNNKKQDNSPKKEEEAPSEEAKMNAKQTEEALKHIEESLNKEEEKFGKEHPKPAPKKDHTDKTNSNAESSKTESQAPAPKVKPAEKKVESTEVPAPAPKAEPAVTVEPVEEKVEPAVESIKVPASAPQEEPQDAIVPSDEVNDKAVGMAADGSVVLPSFEEMTAAMESFISRQEYWKSAFAQTKGRARVLIHIENGGSVAPRLIKKELRNLHEKNLLGEAFKHFEGSLEMIKAK